MSQSIPKVWATEMVMSGNEVPFSADAGVWNAISCRFPFRWTAALSDRGTVFQSAVGEIDRLQLLLGRLVPAIGVGMELLGQGLVAPLDLLRRRPGGQSELGQRLLDLALRAGRFRRGPPFGEGVDVFRDELMAEDVPRRRPTAERPSGPVPDRVAAHRRLDLLRLHPGIVVPGAIIVAHMVEAEPEIVVQPVARLRRPIEPFGGAAGMVAGLDRRRRILPPDTQLDLSEPLGHGVSMGRAADADKH